MLLFTENGFVYWDSIVDGGLNSGFTMAYLFLMHYVKKRPDKIVDINKNMYR